MGWPTIFSIIIYQNCVRSLNSLHREWSLTYIPKAQFHKSQKEVVAVRKKDTPDNSLQEGYPMIVLQNTQDDEANRTTNATQNNSTF